MFNKNTKIIAKYGIGIGFGHILSVVIFPPTSPLRMIEDINILLIFMFTTLYFLISNMAKW